MSRKKPHLNKYIPQNLNIEALIAEYPPKFKLHVDKVVLIVSLLNEIPVLDKKYRDRDGWVPLHSTLLQKQSIKNFKEYREWMEEAGIIEVNHQYFIGEKSKEYRLTKEYSTPLIIRTIERTNLVKALKKIKDVDLMVRNEYKYLFRWFDGLEINSEAARKYLNEDYLTMTSSISEETKNPIHKMNAGIISIDKIVSKDWHFGTDLKASRLHHNLSNMKSELRNFIRWNGQDLVSVDIRNSQPVMSVLLLNPKFWEERRRQGKEKENFEKNGKNSSFYELFPSFSNISLSIHDLPQHFHPKHLHTTSPFKLAVFGTDDVIKYIQWVECGKLYEEIEKMLLEIGEIEAPFESRRKLKEMMFTVMFTGNKYIGQTEAEPKRLFKKVFPSVYKIFAYTKRTDRINLPLLLQKIESLLILKKVSKRILKERPDLPIFTIHDSVVTTVGNEDYVEEVLKDEICKMIGIVPQVAIEYWSEKSQK